MMHGGITLNAKIEKNKLLSILETNREKHIKDYNEALEGWFLALEKAVIAFSNRIAERANVQVSYLNSCADKPISYETSYDEVISILKMTEDTVIELSGEDFHKLVSDKWDWKSSFISNSTKYGSGMR